MLDFIRNFWAGCILNMTWYPIVCKDYLEHGRLVLKQHGDIFVVGIGPILWPRVFRKGSFICPSLVLGPADKVGQCGLHIRTLGFKQRHYERIARKGTGRRVITGKLLWSFSKTIQLIYAKRKTIHTAESQHYASSQGHEILFYPLLWEK